MFKRNKLRRRTAFLLLLVLLFDIVGPSVSYALTSGPSQPEFSSFEPVATTNMVNEFTGDFTYNLPVIEVPGPHGSGYPLSLSYHSGASPEEEASWVGYGWSLNPGAINRSTRGFPDDYNGAEVKYHNKMPNNWTVSVGGSINPEVWSLDIPLSTQASIRYNNYQGFGYNAGIGVALGKGIVNLGYNVSNGQSSYSFNISPGAIVSNLQSAEKRALKELNEKFDFSGVHQNVKVKAKLEVGSYSAGGAYGFASFSSVERSLNSQNYIGTSINGSVGLNATPTFLEAGLTGNIFGNISVQLYKDTDNLNAFGYLYSNNAGEEDIMDYYYEKESSYNKRDVFLGVPFTNKDYFAVNGEGIAGSFQFHDKSIGHFKPNRTVSETIIANVGGEAELGFNWGAGADVGLGVSAITTRGWKEGRGGFSSIDDNKNDIYLKFLNDPGGEIKHQSEDQLVMASLSGGGVPGAKNFNYALPGGSENMDEDVVGRSSFINYNTNAEIDASRASANHYKRYSLRSDIYNSNLESRNVDANKVADGIGEMAIFNENGLRYVYGIPVYSRNEKNLQYGLQNIAEGAVENNFYVFDKDDKTKLGEERQSSYATAYLLTEITTPDYIDRTSNGPSKDDLGGYTKFNYTRHAGGSSENNWYRWRLPYTGLAYSRNSLSDPKDDLGAYSEGLKELYYLQSIETQTHAAIFVTSEREDGKDAAADAIQNKTAAGSKSLKKLDRIELYSLIDVKRVGNELLPKESAKPIKTVHFDYDYHLSQNLPNGSSGKLTLKRLWFDYEGIASAKISPYRFDYDYSFDNYPSKYQDILDEVSGYTVAQQNPNYDKFNLDAWGNYQMDGASRYDEMKKWVNQKNEVQFDPAAWQLKKITLPTGGEIHVQYEQDDYSYVQDQEAHAMISLNEGSGGVANRYYIDTGADLELTAEELLTMKRLINERYVRDGNKLYFKFLYKLINEGIPSLESCNAEYITGYVDVTDVGIDENTGQLYMSLSDDKSKTPEKVCKDFVKTQRLGNLNPSGDCDASSNGIDPNSDVISTLEKLANMAKTIAVPDVLCKDVAYNLSYFRLPLPISKKGGGVRVKRLMMYDQGLENNPVLYGNEYIYESYDPLTQSVRSSGVAQNEPVAIREENILVDYIARDKQEWYDRIISGDDKKQSEGPLGESILPGASVGYSQIVVNNIHSGRTNTGFNIKEYYTARDYPFKAEKTNIEGKTDYLPAPFGLINIFVNNHWATQGFVFKQNSMHGQPKRDANYSGIYTPELNEATVVSEQEFVYFEPGEKVPMINDLAAGITMENPGKEVQLTFADKALIEEQYDANLEGDASIGIIPFFPFPIFVPQATIAPSLTHTRMEMHTHATTKVVSYPVVIKEVISRQNGIEHREVNLAFDKNTGKPVSVRSYDEFVGSYLKQSIPASWHYDNFNQMATEEGKIIEAAMEYTSDNGDSRITFTDAESCLVLPQFTKGDLLQIGEDNYYHVRGFDYLTDEVLLTPSSVNKTNAPASFSSVKVLRSGNNNRLNDQAGEITFHSTSDDIELPDANDDSRWVSNDFTNDLNAAIGANTEFTLAGPYIEMNMSSYISAVPIGCELDLRDVTVRNAHFVYFDKEGSLDLYLLEFEMLCADGTWNKIDAESI